MQLSSQERDILQKDISSLKKAWRLATKTVPALFVFMIFCWYFDWSDILKFISVVTCGVGSYILIISNIHMRKINADLNANVKTIASFSIDKKKVMGYVSSRNRDNRGINGRKVRREINISDESILQAIANRAEYNKTELGQAFNALGMGNDNEILKYTYHYKGKFLYEEKTEELFIPIEYYLTGKEGQTVNISFAERSRKVFKVEPNS